MSLIGHIRVGDILYLRMARSLFFLSLAAFGNDILIFEGKAVLLYLGRIIDFLNLLVNLILVDVVCVARIIGVLLIVNIGRELDLEPCDLGFFLFGIIGILFLDNVLFVFH